MQGTATAYSYRAVQRHPYTRSNARRQLPLTPQDKLSDEFMPQGDLNERLHAACRRFLTSPNARRFCNQWVVLDSSGTVLDVAADPGQFAKRNYPEPYAVLSVLAPGTTYVF